MDRFPLFFTSSRGKREDFLFGNFQLSLTLWRSTLMLGVAKNLILLLLLHCIDSFLVLFFLKDDLTAGSTYISSLTNHKQTISFHCTAQTHRWLHFLSISWHFFCSWTDVITWKFYTHLRIPARPSYMQRSQFQAQLWLINQCWQQHVIILFWITRVHPNFCFSRECSKAKKTYRKQSR